MISIGILTVIIYAIIHNWKSCFYWIFKAIATIFLHCLLAAIAIFVIHETYHYLMKPNFTIPVTEIPPNFSQDFSELRKVSCAARHNNPGNLRPPNKRTGFQHYASMEEGYVALIKDLKLKLSGKSKFTNGTETLQEIIHIYAPPAENNTNAYISKVASILKVNTNILANQIDPHDLARAIIYVEDPRLYKLIYATN